MKLHLENGQSFEGKNIGSPDQSEGEVVFTTGMYGYPQSLTDPSYWGQIIVFSFPLMGNYGVPKFDEATFRESFESQRVWVKGVVTTETSEDFSHCQAHQSLANWLKEQGVPLLTGVDTRQITKVLREHGTLRGSLSDKPLNFSDPLQGRFVPEVSPTKIEIISREGEAKKTVLFVDCGAKNGIFREFLQRGVRLIRVPYNATLSQITTDFDGVFFSNGPGDPSTLKETVALAKETLKTKKPWWGICLGNQILAQAIGGTTRKMGYGHRSLNQPVQEQTGGRCFITSQNHGYEVVPESLPKDYQVWFSNLNDGSVEGICHRTEPVRSVQFHPEACAGPQDAAVLFDEFVETL